MIKHQDSEQLHLNSAALEFARGERLKSGFCITPPTTQQLIAQQAEMFDWNKYVLDFFSEENHGN
jgi:hypothetical protein